MSLVVKMEAPPEGYAINPQDLSSEVPDEQYMQEILREADQALQKSDYKLAEQLLRAGLARVPKHAECLAALGVCLALGKRRLRSAEKLARLAVQLDPSDPHGYIALARINLVGGRRQKAFGSLHEARRMARGNAGLQSQLAQLEPRRPPVLPFLSRNHRLNIMLGRARAFVLRGQNRLIILGVALVISFWTAVALSR